MPLQDLDSLIGSIKTKTSSNLKSEKDLGIEPSFIEKGVEGVKQNLGALAGRIKESTQETFQKGSELVGRGVEQFKEGKPIQGAMNVVSGGIEAGISPAMGVIGGVAEPAVKDIATGFSSLLKKGLSEKMGEEAGMATYEKMKNSFAKDVQKIGAEYEALPEHYKTLIDFGKSAFDLTSLTGVGSLAGEATPLLESGAKVLKEGAVSTAKTAESGLKALGEGVKALPAKLEKTPDELMSKATEAYRNILRPEKGEIKNIEIKGGKDIDDIYKIAAEEKIQLGKTPDGKIDTSQAREQLSAKMNELNNKLNESFASDPFKQHNLKDIAEKAKTELRKDIKNDTEFNDAVKQVDDYINDAIGARGEMINSEKLNNFKQGMWSVSYDQLKPTKNKVAKKLGTIAKQTIEKAHPEQNIKALNELYGKYATLSSLLENAQGRVVKSGAMGKHFATLLGGVVGTSVPVVGPLAGAYAGMKLSEFLGSPIRLAEKAAKGAEKAAKKGMKTQFEKAISQ